MLYHEALNLLQECKEQLSNSIKQLNTLANSVENSFIGIGNEKCAGIIREEANRYSKILSQLCSVTIVSTDEDAVDTPSSSGGKIL